MNPQFPTQDDNERGATPTDTTPNDTQATPAAETVSTSPEADAAALQAIEALEAEESPIVELGESASTNDGDTIAVNVTSAEPTPLVVPSSAPIATPTPVESVSSTPFSTFGSNGGIDSPAPAFGAAMVSSLKEDAPTSTIAPDPFGPKKKSKKGLIIAIVLILVLAGGGVAGYFVWQSLSAPAVTNTVEEQPGGDLPSNPDQDLETTPTAESVESEASTIESDLNSVDTSELNDATLNDASLLQN